MRYSKQRGVFSNINITPLVDVMLVLLVIFMVTTPIIVKGIKVNLPRTHSGSANISKKDIIITITERDRLYIDKHLSTYTELNSFLKQNSKSSLVIEADKTVPYGLVAKIINIAKADSIQKVALATRNKPTLKNNNLF
ncbi:ExbD/TolR family protein [Desulfurella sp.]|uniref:ExbD/TolR family protein n=1 Tax=Desulfurella sp. TaxID=1962857 RepID=UPI003D11F10E